MNILITQVSKFGAMCWIKCLKRTYNKNIVLYGVDTCPKGYCAGSQLVDYYYQISNSLNSKQYLDYLENICNIQKIDLLLSVMDDELALLIQSRCFEKIMFHPTYDTFSIFHDKYVASKKIQNLGLLIPKIIENPFGQKKVIIRDRIGIGSRGVYIVDLEKEAYIQNRFQESRFMQQYIDGEEYTVDIMTDKNGIPVVIIPRKRLEIRQGISFKSQLINDSEIIEICKIIYNNFKIPGISNVQFIKNNSGIYFIELNTRIGGTSIASIISGFNFIELYLQHYIENKAINSFPYYQNLFAWNSIISRDYTEYVYLP